MIGEAQLYHYKARAYSPALGRFMQTDPAGYASDVNLYVYAGNDPLDLSDPSGMVLCMSCTTKTIYASDQDPGALYASADVSEIEVSPPVCGVGEVKVPNAFGGDTCASFDPSGNGPGSGGGPGNGGGGNGGKGGRESPIVMFLCTIVPSGRVAGISGSIGGIGSNVVSGTLVQNYRSGQVTAFGAGSLQLGWNAGLSGSIFGGFIWGGLYPNNSNYGGRSYGGNLGTYVGVSGSHGSGLTTAAASVNATLLPSLTFGGTVNQATSPLQLGKSPPISAVDQALALANQACHPK
jgi:hypothetical protein